MAVLGEGREGKWENEVEMGILRVWVRLGGVSDGSGVRTIFKSQPSCFTKTLYLRTYSYALQGGVFIQIRGKGQLPHTHTHSIAALPISFTKLILFNLNLNAVQLANST